METAEPATSPGGPTISSDDWTDAELLELMALAGGDRADSCAREAFRAFYERHAPWLRAMLRTHRVGHLLDWSEGRSEAIQETFCRAYTSAGTFDLARLHGCSAKAAARKVRAWLGAIANNLIMDILRAQGPEVELLEDSMDAALPPLEVLEPEEPSHLVKALTAEMQLLSDKEKEVLKADMDHKLGIANEHLPPGAAIVLAEKWGTTVDYVRKVRQRAYQKLHARLSHLVY